MDGRTAAINFSILQLKDPHLIDVSPFQYHSDNKRCIKRHLDGMTTLKEQKIVLNICTECHSVPHLALANHLYRGKLPDEFRMCWRYTNHVEVDCPWAGPGRPSPDFAGPGPGPPI